MLQNLDPNVLCCSDSTEAHGVSKGQGRTGEDKAGLRLLRLQMRRGSATSQVFPGAGI